MRQGVVETKEHLRDHEAGSGNLYIPILGDLFPSLFGQEMKAVDKWVITVRIEKLYRCEVDKVLYDKISIGETVIVDIDKYGMLEIKLLE